MSKSVEKRLAVMLQDAPGDVRAAIAANQQRVTAQAEIIAKLEADLARIAEILGPKLEGELLFTNGLARLSFSMSEARELQALLKAVRR